MNIKSLWDVLTPLFVCGSFLLLGSGIIVITQAIELLRMFRNHDLNEARYPLVVLRLFVGVLGLLGFFLFVWGRLRLLLPHP